MIASVTLIQRSNNEERAEGIWSGIQPLDQCLRHKPPIYQCLPKNNLVHDSPSPVNPMALHQNSDFKFSTMKFNWEPPVSTSFPPTSRLGGRYSDMPQSNHTTFDVLSNGNTTHLASFPHINFRSIAGLGYREKPGNWESAFWPIDIHSAKWQTFFFVVFIDRIGMLGFNKQRPYSKSSGTSET